MFRIRKFGIHKSRVAMTAVFQYIFLLCIIVNFRSIWMHTNSLRWVQNTVNLLMGLSVLGGVLTRKRISSRVMSKCIIAFVCVGTYVGIWYIADSRKSNSIFTILLQLLAIAVYCLMVEDSVNDTLNKYTNIVLVIAVVSLFFWVFGSLLGYIKPTGVLYTTWTGNDSLKTVIDYYGIYFETQSGKFFGLTSGEVVRNTAIFTEAPMASMVFSIALLNELLMRIKLDWKRCMILMVAVISSTSIAGCTVIVIAFGFRYMLSKPRTNGHFSLKLLLLPIVLVVALVALSFLVEYKLGTSSGSVRLDDFVAGYKVWLEAPLFGNGYGNSEAYKKHMSSFRSNNLGFSNSPMLVLAYGGIYLLFPYCLSAVMGFTRLVKKGSWNTIAFYIVFLYAFVITVCPFQMLTFYLFISMATGRHLYMEETLLKM